MKNLKISVLAIIATVSFTSCSSDDDNLVPVNEEEVITTLTATFTPQGGGTAIVLQSQDLDGDGPDAPVITVSGDFAVGTTYTGTVTFLNELANPVDNITEEVLEEGDEHQIFFLQSNLGTFTYDDQDVNRNPIGLHFTYNASETATSGDLTIVLRHEPNKTAEGVSNGDITNAGGGTDASATFSINVN